MSAFYGVIIGAASFVVIGIFHPIVVKCEYHFTYRIWPVFLIGGICFCIMSLFAPHVVLSSILAVIGFAMLWSIRELREQAVRVERGWFPKNPKHMKDGGRK